MAPRTRLQPELSDLEWDLIVELLEAKRIVLPLEIHHTSTHAYRKELRQRLELIDALLSKLRTLRGHPATRS